MMWPFGPDRSLLRGPAPIASTLGKTCFSRSAGDSHPFSTMPSSTYPHRPRASSGCFCGSSRAGLRMTAASTAPSDTVSSLAGLPK